jgi:dGTPase
VKPKSTVAPRTPASTLTREEVEAREARDLGTYAMRCAESKGRVHDEPEHAVRTAYMRDRDRVIHASAFRRLEYKTQVFVNHEGDYYRTRLTHTMEVAQVARTAARALRLNEDLTEAIALSHDVGHGPFGHAGEEALKACMKGHGGFEHNAHGLRVVDVLERRYAGFRGLNLSFEVREAFAMHSPNDKESMGFERRRPILEAQLVDLCDGLTYTAHDLDDGVAAGCVEPEQLRGADLWRDVWDRVVVDHPDLPQGLRVSTTVKRIIDACVQDLLDATTKRITESGVSSPDDVRAHPRLVVGFSEAFGRRHRELSRFLHEHFYRHARLVRMARKARRFLSAIFDAYVSEPAMLDRPGRAWAEEVGLERAVCDRIAAMTDREALDEHRRLFLPE